MSYPKSAPNASPSRTNSQKSPRPRRTRASTSGSFAISSEANRLKVLGYKDQFDGDWVEVTKGQNKALARLDTFMANQAQFYLDLKTGGVLIVDPKVKSQMGRLIENMPASSRKVYVALNTGWYGQCFIKPDHSIIGKPPRRFVLELANRPVPLAREGTFEGWNDAVQTFSEGQATLTTALCLAYLGPLLPLMGKGNVGLDLTGQSSIGKSSALDLAASVWGAPCKSYGSIAASLRTTDNAAEQLMLSRADAFLPLDEVNLQGIDARRQADGLGNLAFLLGEGVGKNRFNDLATRGVSLTFMTTSNKSIADQLRLYDQSNAEAAALRLITVNADAGAGYGVFDHLPDGYDSSAKAVLAMKAALVDNHGHSIDLFLKCLVDSLKRDRDGLLARIERNQQDFMERCGVAASDGMAHRRALAFASIYAAGRLAKHYGALPLKAIRKSVITCYKRSLAAACGTKAIERVRSYLLVNKPLLRDLDDGTFPNLGRKKLDTHSGFLKTRKGRRCLMMRKSTWESAFGNSSRAMLDELKAADLLQTTDGLQLQAKVRANREKDRVYAVIID